MTELKIGDLRYTKESVILYCLDIFERITAASYLKWLKFLNENVVDMNLPKKTKATSTARVLMNQKIYSPTKMLAWLSRFY